MPLPTGITHFNRDVLNPLTLRLAGHAHLADVTHVGRKSGLTRHTPVMAFLDKPNNRLVIALDYGPNVQWYKNVKAAGSCTVTMGHLSYHVGAPQRIPAAEALPIISQPVRTFLRWPIRCKDFIALPILETSSKPSGAK